MGVQLKLVQDPLPGDRPDPVLQVFEFWKAMMDKSHSQLGPKRRQKIRAALEMGYSLDDLRLAVVGCKYDSWSQGSNDRGRVFDDVELICRDETKIDAFIELGKEYMKRTEEREKKRAEAEVEGVRCPDSIRARLDALFSRHRERKTSV